MAMESTPDSGVEIRNEVTAPLLAPCFFRAAAAGRTPHEHRGMGMPMSEALNTDLNRPCPRCRETDPGLRKTRSNPLTISPKRMKTDDSSRMFQD